MSPHSISSYELLDQAHSAPNHAKIIHVGAGASGLLAAYKAERMLKNYELICYEKCVSRTAPEWEQQCLMKRVGTLK
jgi:ribulose 1,5-bisphosphate synthetase/thiazole synthase